ncbi:MAG: multicopper oxidase domain-containing protein [Acidimicrobiia bacterium]|nr:multicopper oxidase domain-containing protein [Acidimicrobiia bacterium]MDH5420965.1 multicopper oxidase domain-containing protein [Acidimicrobiia bacterium]MDH5503393.1 multicopper oxidase domain-containing protein [Acidimicrobiia bacterium]
MAVKDDPFISVIRLSIVAVIVVLSFWALFAIVNNESGGSVAAGEAAGGISTATIELSEFAIEGDLTLPTGDVDVTVVNVGGVDHDLTIRGSFGTQLISAGQSEVLELRDLQPGTIEVYCSVPGHEGAGMVGTITVAEGAVVAGGGHGEHEDPDWEALDQAMIDSILAFPAETEGLGNQLLEPTILADGTKEFELTAEIVEWEVEPGKFVEAWTYNGMVPGPAIKVDLGDKVKVIVHNKLPMGTDVHWHGVDTPNNMDGVAPLTQPLIRSGEDYVYEFVADAPAIGMYHAHHHAQMQVTNGMFAIFQIGDMPIPYGQTIGGVEIPADLEVALDIPMVVNDAGVIGYSINGKSFPATQPYVVNKGDWIVATYYNEGLQIHPMHLHQFGQLVFAKDGFPLDNPYWADTINVAPGERYSVLIHAEDAGAWVWHCHILTHVEREEGMFGMVTAVIVQDN